MAARTTRRRQHKQLARLAGLAAPQRLAEARCRLLAWHHEAHRRARTPAAPAVWGLARDHHVQAVAATLEPGGELKAELDRACAEAVASQVGRHLVGASRPAADRTRRG